jgi:hypothetical protein
MGYVKEWVDDDDNKKEQQAGGDDLLLSCWPTDCHLPSMAMLCHALPTLILLTRGMHTM